MFVSWKVDVCHYQWPNYKDSNFSSQRSNSGRENNRSIGKQFLDIAAMFLHFCCQKAASNFPSLEMG
jgi:hypothetical protein